MSSDFNAQTKRHSCDVELRVLVVVAKFHSPICQNQYCVSHQEKCLLCFRRLHRDRVLSHAAGQINIRLCCKEYRIFHLSRRKSCVTTSKFSPTFFPPKGKVYEKRNTCLYTSIMLAKGCSRVRDAILRAVYLRA